MTLAFEHGITIKIANSLIRFRGKCTDNKFKATERQGVDQDFQFSSQ